MLDRLIRWMKETLLQFSETLFISCTGMVLQECVQSQGSMASNEISEVRVYMVMMYDTSFYSLVPTPSVTANYNTVNWKAWYTLIVKLLHVHGMNG